MSHHLAIQNSLNSITHSETIRLIIVDDQDIIRKILCLNLKSAADIEIVAIANNGETALKLAKQLQPHIVLVDIEMPGMSGIEITQKLSELCPDIKTIILSNHKEQEYIDRSFDAGAKGYLQKDTDVSDISDAIRFVHRHYIQCGRGLFLEESMEEELQNSHQVNSVTQALPQAIEEEDNWSMPTKELLDALPKVWTRGLAYILIILAGVAIPWVSMSRIDEIGTARGRLEPKGKVIPLDAPVVGKVTSVQVQEGDTVKIGQTIAELESELIEKQLDELQEKQSGQQNRLVQLELLKNQLMLSLPIQEQQNQAQQIEKKSQVEQARQNFNSLDSRYLTQKEEKQSQVEQFAQAVDTSEANVRLASVALQGAKEKAARYGKAFQDGIIPEDRYQDVKREAAENKERLAQANSELAQARFRVQEEKSNYNDLIQQIKSEIAQAKLRLKEQESAAQGLAHSGMLAIFKTKEQLKNLETDILDLNSKISQTKSQIAALKFQLTQQVIKAPADGVVFDLPIAGQGTVVQPGDRIVDIAPENSALILKAQMSPTESGFLKVGMPVKVKFDAYPFQDYGIEKGRLTWISPNSKYVEMNQGRQEVFELVIELDRPYVEAQSKRIILTPGQTATAEVVVQQRRIIDLILDPFKKLKTGGLEL